MSELSVYLHIPFCRHKCAYCDFYSAPADAGAVSAYVSALCRQIRACDDRGAKIATVYMGGGTPSLLSDDDFSAVSAALRETFDLSSITEWTVEANPESVTAAKAEHWLRCGVNRVSVGVQSFSDVLLRRLGRIHNKNDALRAYGDLRRAGVKNISMDLMLALPGQTGDDLRRDLEQMLVLAPEHLSAYLLSVEPDTPFGRAGVAEAEEETQRQMYLLTHRLLTEGGYEHYEISNFARPGYRARHNTVYWRGGEYLAFGPGAAGFRRSVRYRIPPDTAAFVARGGEVRPIVEETVDALEAKREAVFLGLRLKEGIPFALIPTEQIPLAEALIRRGDAVREGDRFALTPTGFLISDQVIASFLAQ